MTRTFKKSEKSNQKESSWPAGIEYMIIDINILTLIHYVAYVYLFYFFNWFVKVVYLYKVRKCNGSCYLTQKHTFFYIHMYIIFYIHIYLIYNCFCDLITINLKKVIIPTYAWFLIIQACILKMEIDYWATNNL